MSVLTVRERLAFDEAARLLEGAYQLDHSTSIAELGTLFEPYGDTPLQKMKRRIAAAYGVSWSLPGTQGTTSLNVLALMTACRPGGRVLVNRDAHTSVMAAMIHGGFEPVYLVPRYDAELGVSLGPTHADFQRLLDRERVDCIFLTSPNYFGIVGDLAGIIASAHERGLPVVVDAAHAPHYHFCSVLPTAAEDLQADYVTQSTHKVASTLSQGSVLLLRHQSSIERLYEHVNDLGLVSTSFSFPILCSIELGIAQLVADGDDLWRATAERADAFRSAARGLAGLDCFGREQRQKSGFTDLDVTRITLDVSGSGMTGFDVERRLQARRIYPEMATLRHVLFLLTPGTTDDQLRELYRSLEEISRAGTNIPQELDQTPPSLPAMAMIPRTAKFAKKRIIELVDAAGHVSGETIATYPPGTPIIAAGEVFSPETIEFLTRMHRHGAVMKGATDPRLRTVKVIDE
jgi:arginine/lysine/ornithine decarboxylase